MQTRSFQWKDDDYTDAINRHHLNIVPYGLYCGFDAQLIDGLTLNLIHTLTGITEVSDVGARTSQLGKLITQQGCVVIEDGTIGLTIAANASGFGRIDTIIVEHLYVETVGGVPAIYKVIQGTPSATPVPATIPFPEKQMAIGYLHCPGGMTTLAGAGVTYTRPNVPTLGNDASIMRTNVVQTGIVRKQMLSLYGAISSASIAGGIITGAAESNFYVIPNTSSAYVDVHQLAIPFRSGSYCVDILTQQRLKLWSYTDGTTGGNLLLGEAEGNTKHIYIEPGEILRIVDLSGTVTVAGVSMYVISKAGYANKGNFNKYTAEQVWNKGTATAAGSTIALDNNGNYYIIPMTGGQEMRYMPTRSINNATTERGGGVLFVNVTVTSDSTGVCVLKNNFGTIPTGNKAIKTFTGADITLHDGDFMCLVEDELNWWVVNLIGSVYNPVKIAADLASFITTVAGEFTTVNSAISTLTTNLASLTSTVSGLEVSVLAEAKAAIVPYGLEPNIILKGAVISSVVGDYTSGTLVIASGIAQIDSDVRAFPAYTGAYPVYLEKHPTDTTTMRWVVAPLDSAKSILFDPYTSQYLKDVTKRAAWDFGDIRTASVLTIDFDASGRGRWKQLGFKLMNGLNGTQSMVGQAMVGYNDQPVPFGDTDPEYEYRTLMNTLGEKKHTLVRGELPAESLYLFTNNVNSTIGDVVDSSNYVTRSGETTSGDAGLRYELRRDTTNVPTVGKSELMGSGTSHENRGPRTVVAMLLRYDNSLD